MSDLSTGPGPFYVGSESEFVKNSGWERTDIYEGTEAECNFKRDALVSTGATRIRVSAKGNGAWQVRVTYPFNPTNAAGNFVDTMELETNVRMMSVYQSPIYRSRFSDYNTITRYSYKANAALGPIADCARKYLAGQPARDPSTQKYKFNGTDYTTRELAIEAELALRLNAISGISASEFTSGYQLFVNVAYRGVTSFIEYGSVFRRTVTVGSPDAVRANNVGAGKIWTTAEVISWEGLSGGYFDLDPSSQWHKDKPRVLASYGQKTQITYSYTEIVTASALLYQAYGNAVLIDT